MSLFIELIYIITSQAMINVKDKIIVRNPKLFMSNPELYSKT
jgi:hypothetical protein